MNEEQDGSEREPAGVLWLRKTKMKLKRLSANAALALLLAWAGPLWAKDAPGTIPLYQNNFEQAALDKVPDDFLVLAGAFAVKEEGGQRFLELPGAPVEDFALLFGPTESSDAAVSARIHAMGKGRRFPAFGLGLNGVGGFKLQVAPAKKALELYKGDEVVKTVPFSWSAGAWTQLRLEVRKTKEGAWTVEGKAWKQGEPEPADWSISHDETTEPVAGRALISGNPFSGSPIRFDDLVVTRLSDKR